MTDDQPLRSTLRHGRLWLVGLVGLVVVLGAAAAGVVAAQDHEKGPSRPRPTVSPTAGRVVTSRVAAFSASRGTTTRAFTAGTNWQLRWAAPSGSRFSVELLDVGGASLGRVVTAGKKVTGSTYVSQAGTFTLNVTSSKPWTIQVYSRPVAK